MARFAIYSNGKKLEILEDLKENFTNRDMVNNFRTKSLHRWLAEKGLREELQKLESISPAADNLENLLMECFALSDEQKTIVKQRAEEEAKRIREQEAKEKQEASLATQELQSSSDTFDITEVMKSGENLKITWENDFYDSPTKYLLERLHNLIVVTKEKIILSDGYNLFFESEDGMTWSTIKNSNYFCCHRIKKINDRIFFFNTLPPQYGDYSAEGTYASTDIDLSYWDVQHTKPAIFDFYFDGSQFWPIGFKSSVTAGIMSHMTAWDIDETVIFKDKYIAAGLRDKDQQPAASFNRKLDEYNTSFSSYIMTRDSKDGRFHLQITTPSEGKLKKYQHIRLTAFENIVFMLVNGTDHEETQRTVFYSYDGESWGKLNVGFDFIVKINNVFFAYSKDSNPEGIGKIISAISYSGDGINWKMIKPPKFIQKADRGKGIPRKRIFLCDFIVYKDKLLGLLSNNKFVFGKISTESAEISSYH